MSKKYNTLAQEIIKLVGGNENVNSLHHCQTRLRFKLVDDKKADKEAIENLDGVSKVLLNGGMFQVVIGMRVAEVYEEVIKYLGDTGKEEVEKGKKKQKPLDVVADFISSIFSPIVPALAGAGMIKALLALLIAFNLVDKSSQTYVIINMIGDATFAFMPILLAYTTAQKLKCNPLLAAVVAGVMCHATWSGLVDAKEAVNLFGIIPLYLVKYTGSCIPIVLVILVQAPVEKFLNRIIPNSIRLVFAPMILFLVMSVLSLSIIGPLGDYVGAIFTMIFTWLSENVGWLEAMLLAGVYPVLVIFGLHHGIAPLGTMQMAQMGYDAIFGPAVVCANVAQGTASLITGILSKDNKTRQIGTSVGVTGLMGVTEPALYGINVPKKYPLIAGLIGSACGGLYAGLMHTHRFATGSSGLPAVVMYIGGDSMANFYNILIALTITIVVSAIFTVIFVKKFEKNDKSQISKNETQSRDIAISKKVITPIAGKIVPLKEVKDDAFSSEALGKGVAIEPENGTVVAPFDGTIISIFPTKHAIAILSDEGIELLIHIGLNTVELNGKYFETYVNQGDKVKAGQKLVTFDLEKIKAENYCTEVPVVITNSNNYSRIDITDKNFVSLNDELIIVES